MDGKRDQCRRNMADVFSLFYFIFFFFEGPETTVSVLHIFASLMEFACCDCTAKSVVES